MGQLVTPAGAASHVPTRPMLRRQQRRPASRMPPPLSAPRLRRNQGITMGSVILLVFILVQPPLRSMVPWRSMGRQETLDLPGAPATYSNDTPIGAVAYLRQHPLPGPIFNESGIGSYVIWAVGEPLPVFIDPRVELFPPALWEDYQTISRGADLDALLITKYQISRVILNRRYQEGLTVQIARNPNWVLEYTDGVIDIYRRAAP